VPAEACSGKRHHVVCMHADVKWLVQGYVAHGPNRDVEVKLGDPVLRPALQEAKQQAQWLATSCVAWQKTRRVRRADRPTAR
jgi:hypothetical protein